MTIAEKLLARAAGLQSCKPGDFVTCKLSLVLANDITAPIAIEQLAEMGAPGVFDRNKVALVADHYTPTKDIKAAQQVKKMREFAYAQEIVNFYEGCHGGIEHIILPDFGLVLPGDVVIGADSHTCTYGALGAFATGVGSTDAAAGMATGECWFRVPETLRFRFTGPKAKWVSGKDLILYTIGRIGVDGARYQAMEFCGDTISALPMHERFTICNMAIEAGGKCGIIEPDAITEAWVKPRAKRAYVMLKSDGDEADYARTYDFDTASIEPQIACPHLPENTKGISEIGDVRIDQAVVGACTNGRLEDLRVAAEVLKGRQVDPKVRCIIIPGSQEIHLQATREGLVELFLEAGCVFSPPTCGPCLGGHMGILADGERAIATTNRNFVGRMGHVTSEVYLANPAITAASAILGRIGSPEEL